MIFVDPQLLEAGGAVAVAVLTFLATKMYRIMSRESGNGGDSMRDYMKKTMQATEANAKSADKTHDAIVGLTAVVESRARDEELQRAWVRKEFKEMIGESRDGDDDDAESS